MINRPFNLRNQKETRQRLRSSMPPAEYLLWNQLKKKQVNGYKFRRQYGVGPYILDFYCHQAKLAIEIDGDSHFEPAAKLYDQEREIKIKFFGIRILRFTNLEIYQAIDTVLGRISDTLGPPVVPLEGGQSL